MTLFEALATKHHTQLVGVDTKRAQLQIMREQQVGGDVDQLADDVCLQPVEVLRVTCLGLVDFWELLDEALERRSGARGVRLIRRNTPAHVCATPRSRRDDEA